LNSRDVISMLEAAGCIGTLKAIEKQSGIRLNKR